MTNEKSTAKTKDEMRCGWVLRAGVYEDEVLRYVLEHCTDMALAEVRALLQGWGIYLL